METTPPPVPTLNPWLSIWTQPRLTIQQIVDTDPTRSVLPLAMLGGFANALNKASERGLGDKTAWPFVIFLALVSGAISGIIGLFIGSLLLRWTGSWIGGRATSEQIRSAMAWSYVPIACSLVLWIPQFALFGEELLTQGGPHLEGNIMLITLYWGIMSIECVLSVWSIVILLHCLGQVQGFSAWKALSNCILATLVIAVPIFVIVLGSFLLLKR